MKMANDVIGINYTWIIDFDELAKTNKTYRLPIFLGEDAESMYQLSMRSKMNIKNEYFIFLKRLGENKIPLNNKITISIFSPETGRRLSDSKITNEETESISFTFLESQLADCVHNRILTIICEVTGPEELESAEKSIYKPFMDNEKLSDVRILVGEEKYSAHKLVLSANSPVFCNMFSHDMKESRSNQVEIEDMDQKIFKELLRYMYTGKVKNLEDLAEEILKGANRYEIENLKLTCEKLLTTELTVVNVVYYLNLSADYDAAFLKEYCLMLIIKNFENFVKEDGFKHLSESHSKVAVELVEKIGLKYRLELK